MYTKEKIHLLMRGGNKNCFCAMLVPVVVELVTVPTDAPSIERS